MNMKGLARRSLKFGESERMWLTEVQLVAQLVARQAPLHPLESSRAATERFDRRVKRVAGDLGRDRLRLGHERKRRERDAAAAAVRGRDGSRESVCGDVLNLHLRRETGYLRSTGGMESGGVELKRRRRLSSMRRSGLPLILVVDPEAGYSVGGKVFDRRVSSRLSLKRALAIEGLEQQSEGDELSLGRDDCEDARSSVMAI